MMACHESKVGRKVPCAGWVANQTGPGNMMKRVPMPETVGEQHETFEETLPKPEPRKSRRSARTRERR